MASKPNEGVAKLKFNLKMSSEIEETLYIDLEKWRVILYKMNLIGEYPTKKVGFGDLSRRVSVQESPFIITGTQTGRFSNLSGSHYTKVTKCDLNKKSIEAIGPIAPSSESFIHHAIYETCPQINVIFYVQHESLWNYLNTNSSPKIDTCINEKSHILTSEIKRALENKTSGIVNFPLNPFGIISFGKNAEEAGKIILESLKEARK